MIVIKLMGGLGNQMFQYALGRRLASERGVPLRLDLSWFDQSSEIATDTVRNFALDGWRIEAIKASEAELAQFPLSRSVAHRFLRRFPLRSGRVILEKSFGFNRRVLAAPATAYLLGYWQSPKYFESIEALLRREFSMSVPSCAHAVALQGCVQKPGAVSVHIRRGDYVRNPETNAYHGVCTIEYYKKAAALISRRIPEPTFVVFTDDPVWARENINWKWPTSFVEHDAGCLPHNDIWLMSQCSHHVIANSSFSWWGAWLGSNPQKRVVAPMRWFRKPGIDTSDLYPEGWIRL